MCLTPRIIVNPTYIKSTQHYPLAHLGNHDLHYVHYWPYEFDFKTFNYRRNGVTLKNLNKFYAYNIAGETIPIYMTVPCGHCLECVDAKQSQILRRCYLEEASSKHRALFLTLTYDDSHLPADGVSIDHIQKFFKRLRSRLSYKYGYNLPLRYCLFSEYGKIYGRAHYHALIFNLDPTVAGRFTDLIHLFEQTWSNGFVYLKHIDNANGIAYTTKYMLKSKNVPSGKNPNFWLASRSGGGLGSPILDNPDFVLQALSSPEFKVTLKVCGQVKTFHLPKFIYDKLVPNVSSFYPQRICSAVRSLCYDLALLHTLPQSDIYGYLTEQYDYVFPPHLVDKYSLVFSHYMQLYKLHDGYFESTILSHYDVPALCRKIDDLISILDDFDLDISKVLEAQSTRERVMLPYVKHCLQYVASLPDETERERILVNNSEKIDLRVKDGQ